MLDGLPDSKQWEFVRLAADPSKLPELPTEVWERVLDEYDVLFANSLPDRNETFTACCLTCRAWLPRSRYHLFKYLIVQSKEQVKQVSKLLHSIPALRTRVETLNVYGGRDGKRDASWIDLVGFHLGPKLKALTRIAIHSVDFSLTKLEVYKFWGAFNRAWRPNTTQELFVLNCTVTHPNQLIRLASATKTESLITSPNKQNKSGLPAPVLPSGISLPLSKFHLDLSPSDLVLSMPWHTLANQCPSLSSVKIRCRDRNVDLSSLDGQLFLVSILCMFHRMQRHSDTNDVALWVDSLPWIEMRTRPHDKSANADNTPLATQPRLRREMVLADSQDSRHSIGLFAKALTSLEDAMVLGNYINRRFHHIRIFSKLGINDLQPDSFESLDGVLSRLLIATHDVHVAIAEYDRPHEGCVVPWATERFPMLTAVVPDAFCNLEAGQPCKSHPEQANVVQQGQEAEGGMVGEATEVEQDVRTEAGSTTGKRKATEGLEADEEEEEDGMILIESVAR